MTKEVLVAPQELFALFKTKNEKKLARARGRVIKWLSDNIANIPIGGIFIVPDGYSFGGSMSWTKTKEGGLTQ